MTTSPPGDHAVVAAMCQALAPYPWRRLTPGLVARLALASRDRHGIEEGLRTVRGAAVGSWGGLEPVERDDARVGPLVDFLLAHRWTDLRLPALCRGLLDVVDTRAR